MNLNLSVLAQDNEAEVEWMGELQRALGGFPGVSVSRAAHGGGDAGQILFIDGSAPDLAGILAKIDRRGRAVFLVVRDGSSVPDALRDGKVDDVLVYPFRAVEVRSKLHHYQQILMWDEVTRLNASFSELIESLHTDLRLAERLQKGKLPARFPEVKGFQVATRYLAGLRSGGDHFDLADSADGTQLSVVLSDSSSYGLSSAVLSVLMRVAMKLSSEETRSSQETVRRIHHELALTLGEKDKLSLFYGVISRKDYKLRYVNLGTSCAFYAGIGKPFAPLGVAGPAITKPAGYVVRGEAELTLQPEDRLVLISDGFVEAAGGVKATCDLLDGLRAKEAKDCLNELVFRVKSKFAGPDDLPEQDCTAVVFDVDSRLIRLARS